MENLAGSHPDLEELAQKVHDLDQRLTSLERRLAATEPSFAPAPAVVTELAPPALPSIEEETTRLVPVLGKALLAVAVAYLLRALAETHVLPLRVCVAAGILYALFFLVLAARTEQKLVAAVHGLTSVMILAPLLWEATVRFHAVPDWLSAFTLWVFCVFGLAIAWKRTVAVVAWITTLAGLITAFALLMATRHLVPFTYGILAMAAAVEFSACLEHWLHERWVVAAFADAAVLLMTFVVTRPGGVPETYAPISIPAALGAQAALLVIYLASIIVRTVVRGITFTTFETAQCILAFLLCLGGAVSIAKGHPLAYATVSVFCLLAGVACYLVSFVFLEGHGRHDRNFYTYAAFGLLLILGGSRLLLQPGPVTFLWAALALGCLYVGGRFKRAALDLHGGVYLALAGVVCGWALWPWGVLLESQSRIGDLTAAQWVALACALPAYLLMLRRPAAGKAWLDRLLALGVAGYAVWAVAGVTGGWLHTVSHSAGEGSLLAAFCPTALTAVLTLLSLGLAWGSRRFKRPEMAWMVYPIMGLAAYKLLYVDFGGSHTLALFVSLLFFGGTLIMLPRLMQRGTLRAPSPASM